MLLATFEKTPNDVLSYDVQFHRWLSEGDNLVDATATIEGSSAVVSDIETSIAVVKLRISGGDALDDAIVTVLANTQGGDTKEVCFRLRIRECH